MRVAIADFPQNGVDEDRDGRVDEDPRGDANQDGFPGIRNVDDDGDLLVDEDWSGRLPFLADGRPNPSFDWRCRSDDDEDGLVDEEAFAGDLAELAAKMAVLRMRVPVDPTTGQAAWHTVSLRFNNDLDYTKGTGAEAFRPGVDPVVQSSGPTYRTTTARILFAGLPPASFSEGEVLTPLIDEDPRNLIDDDKDGRVDEDAPDLVDVRSLNSDASAGMTPYTSW